MAVTQGQKHQLIQMFKVLDSDGSGVVTKEDFEQKIQAVAAVGNRQPGSAEYKAVEDCYMKQWNSLKQYADKNDDGQVTEEEWLSWAEASVSDSGTFETLVKDTARAIFDVMDLDGSGTVSFEEYKKVNAIYGVDEATARKMFDELDGDKNGAITKEEHLKTQDWFFTRLK
jgi:Ca2+-binding EF-hand superfamily protein